MWRKTTHASQRPARTNDWGSRLLGGGISGHWPVPSHAPPRWRRSQSVAAIYGECHWGWAGRPLGSATGGGRTETSGTTETAGRWQGGLARRAIGLREAHVPIPGAKHQAGASPVVPVVPVVPVAGARARSGQVPA